VIYSEGTDFRVAGRVILRKGDARIVWRPGSTDWSGVGMRMYYKAALQAENILESGHRCCTVLTEGGRLSRATWTSVRERIAEVLKVPLKKIPAELPNRTVKVG
jgi:hypothetical protein